MRFERGHESWIDCLTVLAMLHVARIAPDEANSHCPESVNDVERKKAIAMASELLKQAVAFHHAGEIANAEQLYRQLLQIEPNHPAALHLMGVLAMQQGQNHLAIERIARAIEIEPSDPSFYCNLGLALVNLGQFEAAIEIYQRGIQVPPDTVELYYNLGLAHQEQGQHVEATQAFRKALQLVPDCVDYTAALVHELQQLCEWREIETLAQRVIDAVANPAFDLTGTTISPFSFLALPIPTTAAQQLRCARQWTVGRHPESVSLQRDPAETERKRTASRIKIGYMSAEFRDHPVALLTAELFEAHDRDRFEIFGYSIGIRDHSPIGERVIRGFDHFQDLQAATFYDAAQRIRSDEIDILVDLQGHTQRARIEILAHRPVPIQVNYLGYPGTMGADFIDYILVDDYIAPVDQQPFYSEQLVHLPGCFMVNDSQRAIALETPKRSEVGLPEDAFVFCAFNAFYKLTRPMFEVWMRLLKAIPDSVLWLREGEPLAMANLRREAEARNVSKNRLMFAQAVPMPQHLARQRLADLFLDTFPYNQHSTACDALRIGLPVVTLSGETFASRVAGSLLRAVDLPELITRSFEEYESTVLELAKHPERLASIRRKLCSGLYTDRLLNGRVFARTIERAYTSMWSNFLNGRPPSPFIVNM